MRGDRNAVASALAPRQEARRTRRVVIQASSRSWQGGADLCLNPVEGTPAVRATVERFLDADPDLRVVLAAPASDRGGPFEDLFADLPLERFEPCYAADASPLERLLVATCDLSDDDWFLRADGLHFAVLVERALELLDEAEDRGLDVLKFPDDFPIQLTADAYRVGALRELQRRELPAGFEVHPKYALFADPASFVAAWIAPPDVDDDWLRSARERARDVYRVRADVTGEGIAAGDQLAFHYELAAEHLPAGARVLDLACGNGFGTRFLAAREFDVLGGDLDPGVIEAAETHPDSGDARFALLDATALDLSSSSFDAVVSMETIEHVDPRGFLREVARVLRPGGMLVLSTPQNALGHIPINPEHHHEFSLEELQGLVNEHFEVLEVVGIKQGRVVLEGSPRGANMVLIGRKLPA